MIFDSKWMSEINSDKDQKQESWGGRSPKEMVFPWPWGVLFMDGPSFQLEPHVCGTTLTFFKS